MRLTYSKCKPEHRDAGDLTDIDEFHAAARAAWEAGGEALVLELQPGDGTRYRCALAHSTDADGAPGLVFCAWVPRQVATELTAGGWCPDVYDEPFQGLNPFTAAILVDVLRACVFGVAGRRYDYAKACPVEL